MTITKRWVEDNPLLGNFIKFSLDYYWFSFDIYCRLKKKYEQWRRHCSIDRHWHCSKKSIDTVAEVLFIRKKIQGPGVLHHHRSTAGQRIDRQSITSIDRHLTVLIDTHINGRYTREILLNLVLMVYFPPILDYITLVTVLFKSRGGFTNIVF